MESEDLDIRILIVEDHIVVREGLRLLLESQEDMTVGAQAGTLTEALEYAAQDPPDLILLDLDLGGVNIVDRIPELLEVSREARLLVLTGIRDTQIHRRALKLGADGIILKAQASDKLLKAIRKVHAGEVWIDNEMAAGLLSEMRRNKDARKDDGEALKIAALTKREMEIIAVLCEGRNNKQIGDRLFISEMTVRNHLTSILAKLELTDRFELAIYCYRHGLAKPPL